MLLAATIPVRVFFYGLLAFVPSKDRNSATVVVLDAQGSQHLPFVWYEAGTCSPAQGDCTKFFQLPKETRKRQGVRLEGEDITLTGVTEAGGTSLQLKGDEKKGTGALPRNEAEAAFFHWVPSFTDFHTDEESKIDADCLSKPKCGHGAKVVGRMQLTAGMLSTCRLRTYDNDYVYPVQFSDQANKKGPLLQALAELVVLDASIAADHLDLKVGNKFSVSLKPKSGGEVHIAIGNLPPVTSSGHHDKTSPHFGELHTLLSAAAMGTLEMQTDFNGKNIQPLCPVPYDVPRLLITSADQAIKPKNTATPGKGSTGPVRPPAVRGKKAAAKSGMPSPGSRPICPMGTLSPP